MSDEIIGTAILFEEEGVEILLIRCKCGNGRILPSDIPVYPVGGKRVREHQWEYTVRGDWLDVRPSVNWVGVFHNAGSWSVKFQRFDPTKWKCPGDQFREVNGTQQVIERNRE